MSRRLATLLVFTGILSLVWGQEYRATILGEVVDAHRGAIPKATVKATQEGTNLSKETETNSEGIYTLPFLEPGTYTITVSASGFQTVKRTGIVLRVADKQNLPVTMEVGQVTQEVTVVGEQELIQTATAARGLVFDPVRVAELPLNGRQSYMLLALTPGVLFTQRTFGNTGFSGTRGWDVNGSYTMNGGRTGTNQFLLNGAPISSNGTWNVAPNVEAIQEFKVMVNTYDAQYGRSGGGHVNTTVRAGTNDWHGSLFDFWRNTVLDANTRQNNIVGAARGKRNQHQFGGTAGGPIRKNKDFVFFSFEGWQERVPFPTVTDTVAVQLRQGTNFAQFNQTVYDPLTSRLCVNGVDVPSCLSGGQYIRTPFPGNILPASRISPVGRAILSYYPAPNGPTVTYNQNYFGTGNTGRYRYEQPMVRYDKVISDNDRLYFLYIHQDGSEFRNQNGFQPPAQQGNMLSRRNTKTWITDYTRILTPVTVLDVRASYNPYVERFPDVSDYNFTYDKLGIKTLPPVPTFPSKLAPRIQVSGFSDIFGNQYLNDSQRNQIAFSAGISNTRGRHSLKYGMEWATVLRGTQNSGRPTGLLSFNSFWTQQYSSRGLGQSDGSPVATLLLGLPTGGSIDYNDTYYRREPYIAGYIQDDWKVNNKLTLNIGLRYDVQFPMYEIHDRVNGGFDFSVKNPLSDQIIANWKQLKADWDAKNPNIPYPAVPDQIRGGLLFAGINGQPRRTYDWDWTNIQPRIGFAYNFVRKTVVRGGVGIFYRSATQANLTTGFSQSTGYQRSVNGDLLPSAATENRNTGLTGAYSLENPFPNGLVVPSGSSLGLLTNVARGLSIDGRNRPIPRTYQWSFGLERELPWSMVLEVSYVGSESVHEAISTNLSDMSMPDYTKAQANPNFYNTPLPNPFFGVVPLNADFGGGNTINYRNLVRRYPLFNGITYNINPWGKVWYHGLQLRFEKRAFSSRRAGNLIWVLSYTYAKQLEKALFNNQRFEVPNPFDNRLTDIDRPQQFSWSGVWDIPVGKGRGFNIDNKVLDAVIGGWNYNWILTYYAGPPTPWPDAQFICGGYVIANQNPDKWFNNDKTCYSARPPFSFRTVRDRFDWIRDPAVPQLNMAVAKKLQITERWQLEMRGEAFNATNTPLLRGPNTDYTNPQFGKLPIQQDNFPRNIQIGMRLRF
jgi:Carboxypeptidase regulatory-like domain